MIQKYQKKPTIIEAIQYTEETLQTILLWIAHHNAKAEYKNDKLMIHTLEGTHEATLNDFIIKGIHNEFYPCKPTIFNKLHDKI